MNVFFLIVFNEQIKKITTQFLTHLYFTQWWLLFSSATTNWIQLAGFLLYHLLMPVLGLICWSYAFKSLSPRAFSTLFPYLFFSLKLLPLFARLYSSSSADLIKSTYGKQSHEIWQLRETRWSVTEQNDAWEVLFFRHHHDHQIRKNHMTHCNNASKKVKF